MLDQRRKEPRRKMLAFTPVYTLKPKLLLGYLGDLTTHGALVVGETEMEAGKQVTLSIEFPRELPEVGDQPFTLAARVARCQHDESPQYFNVGMEFTDVNPAQAAILEAIIQRYEFRREA
jgi:hypothetical protein